MREFLVLLRHRSLLGPYGLCWCFTLIIVTVYAYGYGSWMIGPLPIIFSLVLWLLSSAMLLLYGKFSSKGLGIFLKPLLSIVFCLCLTTSVLAFSFGWASRYIYGACLVRSTYPLIAAMESYKQQHGIYPSDSRLIATFPNPTHKPLYLGEPKNGDVSYDAWRVGESDVSLFITPKKYVIFVPVEKFSPISFSSFLVYRYDSKDATWQLGRLHWCFGYAGWGPFWD